MASTRLRWVASAGMVILALAVGALGRPPASRGARSDAVPSAPRYPSTWAPYAPPGGGFRVMAPGRPDERQAVTEDGLLHRADFPAPDGGTWFVAWLDVSPGVAAGRSEADLVDLALAPLPERLAARIDEEDVLRDGTHPGAQLHLSATDGRTYLIRVLAAGGRLIEAAAVVPPGADDGGAARFVGSLELDPA